LGQLFLETPGASSAITNDGFRRLSEGCLDPQICLRGASLVYREGFEIFEAGVTIGKMERSRPLGHQGISPFNHTPTMPGLSGRDPLIIDPLESLIGIVRGPGIVIYAGSGIEWNMVGIFADDRVNDDSIAGQAFIDDPRRQGRTLHSLFFASFAGALLTFGHPPKYFAGSTSSC
jgi:hypothetical protein